MTIKIDGVCAESGSFRFPPGQPHLSVFLGCACKCLPGFNFQRKMGSPLFSVTGDGRRGRCGGQALQGTAACGPVPATAAVLYYILHIHYFALALSSRMTQALPRMTPPDSVGPPRGEICPVGAIPLLFENCAARKNKNGKEKVKKR